MKKRYSFILSSFFVLIFVLLISIFASAYDIDTTNAEYTSFYVYNYENDYTVLSYNANEKVNPSAFTKAVAMTVVLEKNPNFDQVITITNDLIKGTSGRFMGLKVGETLTVKDLIYSSLLAGFNDATIVLGNVIFGSVSSLVDEMNQKAQSLSMTDTHFSNCTGLDDVNMYTTLHDMVLFANYIKNNKTYLNICKEKEYKMSAYSTTSMTTITNRNNILKKFKNIYNLSTSSADCGDSNILYYERDGMSYLCVVVNAKAKNSDDTENYAETLSSSLILHAVYDFDYKNLVSTKNYLYEEPIKYSFSNDSVKLYSKNDITVFLPNDVDENDIKMTYFLNEKELKAPLSAGETVGKLLLTYNGEIIASSDLIVKKDVDAHSFLIFIDNMQHYFLSRYFGFAVILIALNLIFYSLYQKGYIKIQRRNKK